MRALIIFTLFIWSTCCLSAQGINGYVFLDENQNGLMDENEGGIANILVSNQITTTTTNSSGEFSFEGDRYGLINVVPPDGYRATSPHWLNTKNQNLNFGLTQSENKTTFTFIHASDTHLDDESLPRLQKFKLMVDSIKPDFVLITGDLIRDALRVPEERATSLYQMYADEISKFSVPVWSVPGNHEIFGIERHKSLVSKENPLYGKKMYHKYLGPNYYSFNYGGVHFMGLDAQSYNDLWYYGDIDPVQLEWIKQDIAQLENETPIVTFQHIPFLSAAISTFGFHDSWQLNVLVDIDGKKQYRHIVANSQEVFEVLRQKNFALALGGHFHHVQKTTFEFAERQTAFHHTAAIVGPTKVMDFEMKSGFTLYQVDDGNIDEGQFIELN
ncbi:MAG: metallophosphoesterase [Cyclobacteriaceae bacterium]